MHKPSYLKLHEQGRLKETAEKLVSELKNCRLCPWQCGVNRLDNETGVCRTGRLAGVASRGLHRGEEPFISGQAGSGTIFFESCNMKCRFCQNWQLSQSPPEHPVTARELAAQMLYLQESCAHNINFVTPTHVAAQIFEALVIAVEAGLEIPLVWNANAYEEDWVIREIMPFTDIFLEDFKYSSNELAEKYSDAKNYTEKALPVLKLAHDGVGDITFYAGVAEKGLHIRHLVLPGHVENSINCVRMVHDELGPSTWMSLMSQYHPSHHAVGDDTIGRTLRADEYHRVVEAAMEIGMENLVVQDAVSHDEYLPDFDKNEPFK